MRIPGINNASVNDLLVFAMAGAGFIKFEKYVARWNHTYSDKLSLLLRRWRGSKNLDEFFKYMFEENGYKCEQFFEKCFYGTTELSCCDMFYATYVSLRGRCYRLKRLFQDDAGNAGRLSVVMKQLPSPFQRPDGLQTYALAFISDNFNDVSWFPRYDIYRNTFMQMQFEIRRYNMSPKQDCNPQESLGLARCLIDEWLRVHVLGPMKCVPFYLRHLHPKVQVCEPLQIVRNYFDFENVTGLNRCVPACYRKIVRVINYSRRRDYDGGSVPAFGISFTYNTMQTDRYDEVVLTTLPGFISQIGGQFGLMLGICIVSAVQLFLAVSHCAFNRLRGSNVFTRGTSFLASMSSKLNK